MARIRSPNYPVIGLPEAIARASKIYEKEHTHKAAPEVVAKAIGYGGLNGASMGVISALKKYGLLEEVGRELKISDAALSILVDPASSLERSAVVRKAAFEPALFAELKKHYGDTLPSDENLRSFLLKRGFALGAVDTPIRAYRETMGLVTSLPQADSKPLEKPQGTPVAAENPHRPIMEQPTYAFTGKQVGSAIPVTTVCSMSIVADGAVTQDGLDRLKQYIDLIKNSFPKTVNEAQKDRLETLGTDAPKKPIF